MHLGCALTSPLWAYAIMRQCLSARGTAAAAIYVTGAAYLFTVSGLFHTVRWASKAAEDTIRKADYIGIHVIINASLVPAYMLLLGESGPTVTAFHVCCALLGIAASLLDTANRSHLLKTAVQVLTPVPGMSFAIGDSNLLCLKRCGRVMYLPPSILCAGLAKILGQLHVSDRDFHSKCWPNLQLTEFGPIL